MDLCIFNVSSNQRRLRIALSALGLLLTATVGFDSAPARAQDIKSESPEQQQGFEALNQWMRQNAAAFSIDTAAMQDPFRTIKLSPFGVGCGDPVILTSSRPPLLRSNLGAFKLVAITMLDGNGLRALAAFEDGAGASYVLRKGDRIGRNNGRIVEITDSTVIVEEPPRGSSKNPVRTIIELSPSN